MKFRVLQTYQSLELDGENFTGEVIDYVDIDPKIGLPDTIIYFKAGKKVLARMLPSSKLKDLKFETVTTIPF